MKLSQKNTLIVFALEEEAQDCFQDCSVLFCGVGKVNAAYHLTRRLALWVNERGSKPELILNLGSAGSTHFQRKSVINCTHFIQRDFDAVILGVEPFATPFDKTLPTTLNHGLRFTDHLEGHCGTGDNFVSTATQGPWTVVDMEAYALAKVCAFEGVPFGCLKYITDGADGHAATTWQDGLPATAQKLRESVDQLFT